MPGRTLIVSGDKGTAAHLAECLESAGYATDIALSARSAATFCRKQIYALAVIGETRPADRISTLVRRLAADFPEISIIMLAGHDSVPSGCDSGNIIAYFPSPVRCDVLLSLARQVLPDVPAKHPAHEGLLNENEFILSILDNIPIGIAVNAIDTGEIRYVNRQFEEIYGWKREEVADIEEFFEKVYPDPEYRRELRQRINADISSGDPSRMVWENIHITTGSGQKKIVSAVNIPLYKQGLMISTVQDITIHRRAEEALKASEENYLDMIKYRELDKMKSRLLSIVSHELRTPLAGIKGYASMLLDYEGKMKPDIRHEAVISIDRAADRLSELINQLIDLSRFEAGLVRLERIPSNLRHIISSAIEDAVKKAPGYRFKTSVRNIPLLLDIDSRRVRQVLDNLLDNAVKFSPPRTVITVTAGRGDDCVQVCVTDQGCGIPAGEHESIFDLMHRMRNTPAERNDGLGLGLALCKTFVESHGGRIWVESRQDRGSSFCFTLPLKKPSD